MSLAANSETSEVYQSIIDRTFDLLRKDADLATVRRDVLDRIKRKWINSLHLDPNQVGSGANLGDSDPSAVVNRSKYMAVPGLSIQLAAVRDEPISDSVIAIEDDDYADEFEDSAFISSSRQLPENVPLSATINTGIIAPVPSRRVVVEAKKELVNVEELDPELLEDAEYDSIPEVGDCNIRIFGQVEVCESSVGSRRSDSRWMVTVLNGFARDQHSNDEFLFRTAKQTMAHFHHHSKGGV